MTGRLAALLFAFLPAAHAAESFEALTRAGAPRELLFELKKSAPGVPTPAARPAAREAARLTLGDETDYLRTSVTFRLSDGRLVHVAGNKDRAQGRYDGYFMSFLVDGRSRPYWVAPDLTAVPFQIEGDTYTVQVLVGKTGLFHIVNSLKLKSHPEGIRIRIAKPADPSFVFEFTAGQLVNAMRMTGSRVALGERVYYAAYIQDIQEIKGDPANPVAMLPKRTLLLLPEMQPQTDSKGNVTYKFGWDDRLEVRGEDATGGDDRGGPKLGQPLGRKDDPNQGASRWAFHVDENGGSRLLRVYDLEAAAPQP